jgi:hypothetical protein
MHLTEQEIKLILENRRKENETYPKRVGVLKHNLYLVNYGESRFVYDFTEIITAKGFFSKEDILDILREIKEEFLSDTQIPKGTKFESYVVDGSEYWRNEDGVLYDMDSEWASENLINIKTVGKI